MHTSLAGEALSVAQRKLVDENLGLVGFELARMGRWQRSAPGRETEDLFQEGCLGLLRAVRTYDAERGIRFAAWALPRIHQAIRRALLRSSPIPSPRPRRRNDRRKLRSPLERPQVVPLEFDPQVRGAADAPDASGATIGQRLGEKFDRAVQRAVQIAHQESGARPDRAALCDLLVRERISIPDESARKPLREIARLTDSSYARVRQCEDRLHAHMRRVLNDDPEVGVLISESRRHARGMAGPVDEEVEQRLRTAAERGFARRMDELPHEGRAELMCRAVELGGVDAALLGAHLMSRLNPEQREHLFVDLHSAPRGRPRQRTRRHRP